MHTTQPHSPFLPLEAGKALTLQSLLVQELECYRPQRPISLAVVCPEDEATLRAVYRAQALGIAGAIFFGDHDRMTLASEKAGINLRDFPRTHATDAAEAARMAVAAVRRGEAAILLKGMAKTAVLLKAVLDKENGLRTGRLLSHVSILRVPALARRLLMTDAAVIPSPDLTAKVALIENAVLAAHGLGIERPKVAALAAVEIVNPSMQATVDAALLSQMNRRGELPGCVVDGPMAIDLALSAEAAERKGFVSEVAGHADILLFPAIEAANGVAKAMVLTSGALFGGVVMGTGAPIALPSRSDSAESKLFSIVCASRIAENAKANPQERSADE